MKGGHVLLCLLSQEGKLRTRTPGATSPSVRKRFGEEEKRGSQNRCSASPSKSAKSCGLRVAAFALFVGGFRRFGLGLGDANGAACGPRNRCGVVHLGNKQARWCGSLTIGVVGGGTAIGRWISGSRRLDRCVRQWRLGRMGPAHGGIRLGRRPRLLYDGRLSGLSRSSLLHLRLRRCDSLRHASRHRLHASRLRPRNLHGRHGARAGCGGAGGWRAGGGG